jgi:hypothetical protein
MISGVVVAALAFAGICGALVLAFGKVPPYGPFSYVASIIAPGVLGVVVYPGCWYVLVARRRDYSRGRTWWLIFTTYALTCIAASVVIFVVGLIAAIMYRDRVGNTIILMFSFSPFAIGPLLLPLYVLVAAPMAFLHRAGLLMLFRRCVRVGELGSSGTPTT